MAVVELPLHLNWSASGRRFDLRARADRARVYEIVLQEGTPADILAYVDGALLVDLWEDLVLPKACSCAGSSTRRIRACPGVAAAVPRHRCRRPPDTADRLERAAELAARRRLGLYDALFVQLARELELPLLISDVKLARAAEGTIRVELLQAKSS